MTRDPKLTIGFAHHTDYDGAYFTIQALRYYHDRMEDVELVVIDNSFGSPDSQLLGGFVNNTLAGRTYNPQSQSWNDSRTPEQIGLHFEKHGLANVKHITMTNVVGTSASRDAIFKHATAPLVLVLDCHVLVEPDAVRRLIEWFYSADRCERLDIYSGPLRYDTMADVTTHFNPVWRSQMFGVWGKAWRCKCGSDGLQFSTVESDGIDSEKRVDYRLLSDGRTPVSQCFHCGEELPSYSWQGHDSKLKASGYYPLGESNEDEPFQIPGCGLGLFAAAREGWPGFNEHSRGFGGEELYIHRKYEQLGRRAICLPWLKWIHRFGRARGVPYPLTLWNKVRNYVLEWDELGLPLDEIHNHFVLNGPLTQADWEHLVDDPVAHVNPEDKSAGCKGCPQNKSIDDTTSLNQLFDVLSKIPRDLDQHMPKLRELASQCDHVTEFTKRRESTIAFLAGRPKIVRSFQQERDRAVNRATAWAIKDGVDVSVEHKNSRQVPMLAEETDLLFIDEEHTGTRLLQQLEAYASRVTRFIVLHDTYLHGEKGQDGGPGLLTALRKWMRDNPKWSVISHTNDEYGLTVIGCRDEDKPKLPPATTMAGNLGKALVGFVSDGGQLATAEELERRLLVCSTCEHRRNTRCAVCGCFLDAKAKMRAQECPLGYWTPKVDDG